MKVFSSGSCRLLTTIHNGHNKIEPIHSMFHNFTGINFLGKLHNTKQHIQFLRWLNDDDLTLPQHILDRFLTSSSTQPGIDNKASISEKRASIKAAFNSCDCYIFEICSLKLYAKDGYQVQYELANTHDYDPVTLQSETDIYNDLEALCSLIPSKKKILFQSHFRPNIIYEDPSKAIANRETIYNALHRFCSNANQNNTILYDPSLLLMTDHSLFDGDTHFHPTGHAKSFEYIYDNFL